MKKILLILYGKDFPRNAFNFIANLNEQNPVVLTGFFLPHIVDIPNWAAYSAESIGPLDDTIQRDNVRAFEELCLNAGIEYRIHQGTTEEAIPQIIKETKFSDVLVVEHNHFYKELEIEDSYNYLESVLHHSECPTLIVSEHTTLPENIILAYDGQEPSVYAIKQFSYLFPSLLHLPTFLTYLHDSDETIIPQDTDMRELVSCHFKNYTINSQDTAHIAYLKSISNRDNCLIVTGSFSRPKISELFKRSFSEDIIRNYRLPIFIAHP